MKGKHGLSTQRKPLGAVKLRHRSDKSCYQHSPTYGIVRSSLLRNVSPQGKTRKFYYLSPVSRKRAAKAVAFGLLQELCKDPETRAIVEQVAGLNANKRNRGGYDEITIT